MKAGGSDSCGVRQDVLSTNILVLFLGTWSDCISLLSGRLSQLSVQLHPGHDLTVCEFEPHIGLTAVRTEPARDTLSPSLSAPPQLILYLKNKHLKGEREQEGTKGLEERGNGEEENIEKFFLNLLI